MEWQQHQHILSNSYLNLIYSYLLEINYGLKRNFPNINITRYSINVLSLNYDAALIPF